MFLICHGRRLTCCLNFVFPFPGTHLGIRVIVDLRGFCDFAQGGVLKGALHILGSLPVLGCFPQEEDSQGGGLDILGNVDDLCEPRHAQRHVLG